MQSALKLLQQNGYLTLTDAMENPARLMFCISRDDLYRLRIRRDDLDHFIRTILRLYNGVFTEFRPIDECELATWSGYKVERVKELLKTLWQLRVIRYIPSNRSPMLYMEEERLPRADLYIAPETYKHRQELMRERFDHMLAYAANETECRSVVLERYFGADDAQPCGICDICLARRRETRRQQTATTPAAESTPGNDTAKHSDIPDNGAPADAAHETTSDSLLRQRLLKLLVPSPRSLQELLDDLRGEQPEEPLADEGPVIEVLRTLQTEGVLHTGTDGRLRISGQQS